MNGGAIALGHPLGCSGASLITTLIWEMRRRGARRHRGAVRRRRPGRRDAGREPGGRLRRQLAVPVRGAPVRGTPRLAAGVGTLPPCARSRTSPPGDRGPARVERGQRRLRGAREGARAHPVRQRRDPGRVRRGSCREGRASGGRPAGALERAFAGRRIPVPRFRYASRKCAQVQALLITVDRFFQPGGSHTSRAQIASGDGHHRTREHRRGDHGDRRSDDPLRDDGLYRGDGVFEVIRLYDGEPFALGEHLDRLERSAAAIELPVEREAIERELEALLAGFGTEEAQLRILLTRGGRRICSPSSFPTGEAR